MKDSINLPPFYIGQRVVCVKTHTSGCPKKGIVYTVLGVYKYPCCGLWVVDYGEKHSFSPSNISSTCHGCGKSYTPAICNSGNYIITHEYFAPIESTFSAITLSEVIEIETPLICNN